MQISFFANGGFVAHKYGVPGIKSKFSVWFNRDGQAIDASRIDSRGRAYPVPVASPAWQYIERHKLAGLTSESEIKRASGI